MESHIKTNQTIMKIGQKVLCILVCLLIIVPIKTMGQGRGISALMDILFPKMEVQAANTPYVAKDLSGMAYSVFSESKSTLYITRSNNTSLKVNDKFPEFTDDQGNTITDGIVAQRELENRNAISLDPATNLPKAGWLVNEDEDIASKVTTVVFLRDVKPLNTTCWFAKLPNMKTIQNAESHLDTSKVTNMGLMFYDCSSLSSLDLSEFNTSKVTNMSGMFQRCSALTSLDLSGFNTSDVTNMSYMFNHCSLLTSLDVSKFNTSNVTSMHTMFQSCSNLTLLNVSGFDTSNVTNMDHMFFDCSVLTSLDTSGFKTSKVTKMGTMFANCKGLTSLDMSGFDTSNVTNMSFIFYGCSSLTSLNISGFDTRKVMKMGSMFSKCPVLSALSIGPKTRLNNDCGLSQPSDTSKFTGKWVLNDPYNHTKQCSADELIAKTQRPDWTPGLWVAERLGADPETQGYASSSANIYDAASHLNADGSIKAGEDPVSLYRANDSGSGYWQKLADGRWAYTFFVFKNNETDWQVWEDDVSGYTGDYTIANPLELAGSKIQEGEQPVITNTKHDGPTYYKTLTLTKKTVSSSGSEIMVDKTFNFTITLSGANISGSQVFGDTAFVNGTAKVKLKGGETISFTDIPAGTAYKIEEDPDSNFTSSIDHPTGIITYKDDVAVNCTNTRKDGQKDYVSFSVKKEVSSNADESDTEFSFHAALSGCEQSTTYSLSDGTKYTSDSDGNANVDFTLKQNQTITFQNIPVGSRYTITEDGGDYLSSYKITDSAGINKIVSSTGKSVQAEASLSTALESVDKGENVLITFQNNITRTQNLIVTKESVKADGSVNADDHAQYLIDILLTGLSGNQKIKTSNGILIADDDGIIENSIYITPSQRLILFDVPVGVKYKFTEEANDKTAAYKLTNRRVRQIRKA